MLNRNDDDGEDKKGKTGGERKRGGIAGGVVGGVSVCVQGDFRTVVFLKTLKRFWTVSVLSGKGWPVNLFDSSDFVGHLQISQWASGREEEPAVLWCVEGWFEVTLNTPSIPPPPPHRCWGGPGEGSGEHSALSAPASWAQPGFVLQGLPLLWKVLPHLPSPEGPPADTHRSVRPSSHVLNIHPELLQQFIIYWSSCNIYTPYLYWHSYWS